MPKQEPLIRQQLIYRISAEYFVTDKIYSQWGNTFNSTTKRIDLEQDVSLTIKFKNGASIDLQKIEVDAMKLALEKLTEKYPLAIFIKITTSKMIARLELGDDENGSN